MPGRACPGTLPDVINIVVPPLWNTGRRFFDERSVPRAERRSVFMQRNEASTSFRILIVHTVVPSFPSRLVCRKYTPAVSLWS